MDFDSPRALEAAFREMHPCFEGKETEQNWQQRDKSITKLKKITASQAPQEYTAVYIAGIRSLLDGILKAVNSLRTTLSTAGCSLVAEIAYASGSNLDNMVEILLQNLIKLCANTKPIARANANEAVLAILSNVSYHSRIMYHVHSASQDKNSQPRRFACAWLKKVIKKHPRGVIEHGGGLDLIEKALKTGLQDRDKDVREAMRPTFWAFARRWPEKSDSIMSTLDKTKQDQLLADASNPNRAASEDHIEQAIVGEKPAFAKSVGSTGPGKPSLKEVKARLVAQKKSQGVTDRPKSAQEMYSPRLEDGRQKVLVDHRPNFSKSVVSSKPSLKDVKARMTAEKRSQSVSAEAVSSDAHNSKVSSSTTQQAHGPAVQPPTDPPHRRTHSQAAKPSFKDIKNKIANQKLSHDEDVGGHGKLHGDKLTSRSPVKGHHGELSRVPPRPDSAAATNSPNASLVAREDDPTALTSRKAATSRSHQLSEARPRSADGPHLHPVRTHAQTAPKAGNLTSAPMRPRRKIAAKNPDLEPSTTLDLGELPELDDLADLKFRSEPLRDDEIPEGQLRAEKAAEVSIVPTKQELFKVHEILEMCRPEQKPERTESALQAIKLLESAQVRIKARSLDVHGFRKLQTLLRTERANGILWQDGYKIEELLLILLEWLEMPLPGTDRADHGHVLDIQVQILSTIRLALTQYKVFARPLFTHALSTLLVSRDHFAGKEHIVSGLEDTLDFIVANCVPMESIKAICDMIEHDLGLRAYELALHTLSSLLHRVHSEAPKTGSSPPFTLGDGTVAQRIGLITTALLEDHDLATRKAAIEVALEFHDCIPEADFFTMIAKQNDSHKNVLLYYLARHKKARHVS